MYYLYSKLIETKYEIHLSIFLLPKITLILTVQSGDSQLPTQHLSLWNKHNQANKGWRMLVCRMFGNYRFLYSILTDAK